MTDDDAVEEAEAALSSADSESAALPTVRMYMREMGQVDLLTARRRNHHRQKNRKCPEKHGAGDFRLSGFYR